MCAKVRFGSFGEARSALIRAAFRRAKNPKCRRKECRPYFCPKCKTWHLTSRGTPNQWVAAIVEAQKLGAQR